MLSLGPSFQPRRVLQRAGFERETWRIVPAQLTANLFDLIDAKAGHKGSQLAGFIIFDDRAVAGIDHMAQGQQIFAQHFFCFGGSCELAENNAPTPDPAGPRQPNARGPFADHAVHIGRFDL